MRNAPNLLQAKGSVLIISPQSIRQVGKRDKLACKWKGCEIKYILTDDKAFLLLVVMDVTSTKFLSLFDSNQTSELKIGGLGEGSDSSMLWIIHEGPRNVKIQANSKFFYAKTQFKRSVIYYKSPSCTFTPSLWYRASIWLAKSVYTRPFANLAAQVPKKVAFLTGRIFARLRQRLHGADRIFGRSNIWTLRRSVHTGSANRP